MQIAICIEMCSTKTRLFLLALFTTVLLTSTYAAANLNSDSGKLEVKTVRVSDGNQRLSGLLYRPLVSSDQNPVPGIVVAHGISESKEIMSGIGLELARRGYVILCLDLPGHGESDGMVGQGNDKPDLGVQAAVQYLSSQTFVDTSQIALIGHSLGAGAVRAANTAECQAKATVLIGGGLNSAVQDPRYGVLNSTFPKNLLVIVGKYDVLFNITDLTDRELPTVFNTENPVEVGALYGSFESQTARKMVTPATTHLFESVDQAVVLETASWMENTLKTTDISKNSLSNQTIYLERDAALLIALVSLIIVILVAYFPVASIVNSKTKEAKTAYSVQAPSNWKAYVVWAILNLILFFPMIAVGLVISFPPLVFGSSMARWALAAGLVGLILLYRNRPKFSQDRVQLREIFKAAFGKTEILTAFSLFLLMFAVSFLVQAVFKVDLKMMAPLFQVISSLRRFLAFLAFIPFFLAYFMIEGVYFHQLQFRSQDLRNWRGLSEYLKAILAKTSPFLLVLGLQYLPKLVIDVWILPSFIGFIGEFLWLIAPIFVITSTCSTWFHRKTGKIGVGAFFNALLLAWIASVVFPF